MNKKIALFSLYDQNKAVVYARHLIRLGWKIVATKETFKLLMKNNVNVTDISKFLGIRDIYPFPPTLHPEIELALTTNKGKTIDLVYDTTYPLAKGLDIGGHTLLALAAKGNRIVIYKREDMTKVIEQFEKNNNEIDVDLRQHLITSAYLYIAEYYSSLIKDIKINPVRTMKLLNGENPYQIPAFLVHTDSQDPLAIGNFKRVSGTPPCYTNMADFDSILKIFCSVLGAFQKYYEKVPYIVIAAKHGNPCGLAIDWDLPDIAIEKALWGNPRAIWGGEVITNFSIRKRLAEKLHSSKRRYDFLGESKWMLDVVIAPDFTTQAINVLGMTQKRKIFKNMALKQPNLCNSIWLYRMVRGGFLRQPPNNYILDFNNSNIESHIPEREYLDSLIIAWGASWFSNHGGNEIAMAKNRKLLSVGGGPSTIDACHTAMARAKSYNHDLKGSVFVADAFFPFTDVPKELVKIGCKYGLVPSGGKNIKLIKNYFKRNNVYVYYLPEQFRGFCRH